MELIGSYISQLSTALHGPRRVKLDLLAESRDSLADAAEAYERDGLPRPEAERRAVEEFGDLAELVPAYQEELAMAQGRRTAPPVEAGPPRGAGAPTRGASPSSRGPSPSTARCRGTGRRAWSSRSR